MDISLDLSKNVIADWTSGGNTLHLGYKFSTEPGEAPDIDIRYTYGSLSVSAEHADAITINGHKYEGMFLSVDIVTGEDDENHTRVLLDAFGGDEDAPDLYDEEITLDDLPRELAACIMLTDQLS